MYMYDLLDASEGLIGHGDGTVNVNGMLAVSSVWILGSPTRIVRFRLLVFRPFHTEVLLGRIIALSATSIQISLDFFEAITVPPELLFENTTFESDDEQGGGWKWNNDGNNLWIDLGDTVRVRVEREEWTDQTPTGPVTSRGDAAVVGAEGTVEKVEREPYKIVGSMNAAGMGPVQWW